MQNASGKLFILATPIGNLGDVSPRARQCLEQADLIATEAVPATRKLLSALHVRTPRLISYREDSRQKNEPIIVWELREGRQVVLVSEAGTPCISDPGYHLVAACLEAEIPIEVVPGPSALTGALASAGLCARRVAFEGFLPTRNRERQALLQQLRTEPRTVVLLEAPHRIQETLTELCSALGGDRTATLLRELTKLHEERWTGNLADLQERARLSPPKGELVLVIAPPPEQPEPAPEFQAPVEWLREQGMSARQVQDFLTRIVGLPRNEAYQVAHQSGT